MIHNIKKQEKNLTIIIFHLRLIFTNMYVCINKYTYIYKSIAVK